jgi:hypothetical protein
MSCCDATYEMCEMGEFSKAIVTPVHSNLALMRPLNVDLNPSGQDTEMTALNSKHAPQCDLVIPCGTLSYFGLDDLS